MSKKSLLDSIEIASPCTKDWNEMIGDDEARFCRHCNKNVYNLSAMTRKKAIKLTAQSGKKVCVRYARRSDGSVQTADQRLYKIAGRASRLAAGAFGASLALSTATYAQGEAIQTKKATSQTQSRKTKSDNSTSQISFTLLDATGAVITNIQVGLINQKSKEVFLAVTNQAGIAQFSSLPKGRYRINIETQEGFGKIDSYFIELKEAIEPNIQISLEAAGSVVVGDFNFTWYEFSLLHAVAQEDVSEVKRLLSAGANVNVKDKGDSELTALHVAVEVGNVELVKILLEAGAKVNVKNKYKHTPLLTIEENFEENTAEIVRLLVAKGADVNAQDNGKETALMMACDEENLEVVNILLEAGTNPNLKDEDGETALQKTDSEEIKQLLKQYGARE